METECENDVMDDGVWEGLLRKRAKASERIPQRYNILNNDPKMPILLITTASA